MQMNTDEINVKTTREELIELIEKLPEEQIAEVATQIKHLIELYKGRIGKTRFLYDDTTDLIDARGRNSIYPSICSLHSVVYCVKPLRVRP